MSVLSRFHHMLYGPENGRKWVFLHGLMGYANNWRTIIRGIESTERCLVFDQRGHGRSHKPDSGYAPENYAQDLLDILKELAWEKIILVGHSLGGRTAINFAANYPEKIVKLIIEDIGPESIPGSLEYYQSLLGIIPTPFNSRAEAKKFLFEDFVLKAKTRDNPKMIADFFYANLTENENGKVDWRFSKLAILESVRQGHSHDRWNEWLNIKVPTLLLRGENSRELSKEVFNKINKSNAAIRCVEIANAGHWIHYDKPNEFISELKKFTDLK